MKRQALKLRTGSSGTTYRPRLPVRRGMTLLELVIATTMLTVVMATISVVLRTGRQAWEAHEADYERIEAAHATLRHVLRRARQAREVVSVSPNTDDSGQLSLRMADDSIEAWDHDENTQTVNYGITTANNLLATNVTGLRFTGFQANGTSVTVVPAEIRALRIEVTVQLPVESGTRRVESWVWIRSW
jgi:prepilin-type N-terminal cleavage/methylation domain-containing protein